MGVRPASAALLGAGLAIGLLAAPARADSQSSNSASNCSNGRCTRVESLRLEDDHGRVRGWRHVEHWREGWREPRWRHAWPPRDAERRDRHRRDRDDDDD